MMVEQHFCIQSLHRFYNGVWKSLLVEILGCNSMPANTFATTHPWHFTYFNFLFLFRCDCVWVYDTNDRLMPQLDLFCVESLPTILHALKIKDAEILKAAVVSVVCRI